MPYVLNDWFLLKIAIYITQRKIRLALSELQRLVWQSLFSLLQEIIKAFSSITGWRLILQVLKRIGCIVKTGLKYIFLELPVPALEFLYILHFVRAFLTLIDFLKGSDNKNLVEITKFLYACFKIVISLVMLSFLIVLLVHGMAPLGLVAYAHIKTLFRVYTFSKFGISLLTLGFSYYKTKSCRNDIEYVWLQAQYQANIQKHTHILVLGTLITGLLTLVSVVGFGLGPIGLAVAIVLGALLLIVDIAKAIYFYKNGCTIPEPTVGSLEQKNSFIDFSTNDYYYRKCRSGRLYEINNPKDYEANKIYLLKEIVVKIIQLETKLKNNSVSRFGFFSEHSKMQEKIEGLTQLASTLITYDDEKNKQLFNKVIKSLKDDYEAIDENYNVLPKAKLTSDDFVEFSSKNNSDIGNFLQRILSTRQDNEVHSRGSRSALTGEAGNASSLKVIVGDLDMNPNRDECASGAGRSRPNNSRVMRKNFGDTTAEIFPEHSDSLVFDIKKSSTQPFRQSFFRKMGDCDDIRAACQKFLTQQKPDDKIGGLRASMPAG